MNNNANNWQWGPHTGPAPFGAFSASPNRGQYCANHDRNVVIGPFRSYNLVVRDYLVGNLSTSHSPPVYRGIPYEHRATSSNVIGVASGPTTYPARDTVAAIATNTNEAARVPSRLDLDAANRSQGPTWENMPMDMIAIYIKEEDGSIDGPPFNLHKSFFTHLSPYFDAVFNSGFAESATQTLHFAESNRQIFAMLIDWVYKKQLDTLAAFELDDRKNLPVGIGLSTLQGSDLDEYINKSQETAFEHTTKLIDLWFLADKVLMPELQNAAIQAIELLRFFTSLQGVPAEISRAVYDKTPKDSPLRKYLAYTTLRRLHPQSEDKGEDFHPDMLVDIFDIVKVAGSDAKLRHYGLSEKAMESFLVEVNGASHLKANPNIVAPLADDIWVSLWELRRNAMKF
ncbi:hypothetical protein BOTCAL_0395g00010 [Botryotinia calthae]|uniref:BTB domain-containing protein n=1 Tax=Botryotinia calthae TaxID=38488 RepID=A0A4Y8CT73_9HELO|nr:hypothetical protein BOTCAL_0395g00010 [Botryotinia calthae]